MKKAHISRISLTVIIIAGLWVSISFWGDNRQLVPGASEASSGKTVNTEDSTGPEIIIDKDALKDLPKPETD